MSPPSKVHNPRARKYVGTNATPRNDRPQSASIVRTTASETSSGSKDSASSNKSISLQGLHVYMSGKEGPHQGPRKDPPASSLKKPLGGANRGEQTSSVSKTGVLDPKSFQGHAVGNATLTLREKVQVLEKRNRVLEAKLKAVKEVKREQQRLAGQEEMISSLQQRVHDLEQLVSAYHEEVSAQQSTLRRQRDNLEEQQERLQRLTLNLQEEQHSRKELEDKLKNVVVGPLVPPVEPHHGHPPEIQVARPRSPPSPGASPLPWSPLSTRRPPSPTGPGKIHEDDAWAINGGVLLPPGADTGHTRKASPPSSPRASFLTSNSLEGVVEDGVGNMENGTLVEVDKAVPCRAGGGKVEVLPCAGREEGGHHKVCKAPQHEGPSNPRGALKPVAHNPLASSPAGPLIASSVASLPTASRPDGTMSNTIADATNSSAPLCESSPNPSPEVQLLRRQLKQVQSLYEYSQQDLRDIEEVLKETDQQRREYAARYAFMLLDQDSDGFISQLHVELYDVFSCYSSEVLKLCFRDWRFTSGFKGFLNIEDFVRFTDLAEDRTTRESQRFWFHVLDLDGDGYVSYQDMKFFYDAVDQGQCEAVTFEDLKNQIVDMVNPRSKKGFTCMELWKSKLGAGVIGLLTNHNNMLLQRTTAEWGKGDFPL